MDSFDKRWFCSTNLFWLWNKVKKNLLQRAKLTICEFNILHVEIPTQNEQGLKKMEREEIEKSGEKHGLSFIIKITGFVGSHRE